MIAEIKYLITHTVCSVLVFICIQHTTAQEYGLYRNILFNNLYNLNPAAAGYDGPFFSQVTFSKKWIGINGSPTGQVFSNSIRLGQEDFYDQNMFVNRPLFDIAKRVGVGFTFFNETSGPLQHTGMMFAYAYHIHARNGRFSFGISGIVTQFRLNTFEFKPADEDDPTLYTNTRAVFPDANTGVLYYNSKFFTGLSMNGINLKRTLNHMRIEPDIVFCAGYKFYINEVTKFEPSLFLTKYDKGLLTDINLKYYFFKNNWFLISFQTNGEALAGVALNIAKGVQVLYSYSINTAGLATYLQGSHIVSIRADIASVVKH